MAITILMITDGAELERLDRSLQRIWGRGLRLVTDVALANSAQSTSPEEHLRLVRPDVLLLGMGQLGVDVSAYVGAARRLLPGCAVCLLCHRQHLAQARELHPDRLLSRPISVAEVQACLAELSKHQREREDARSHSFARPADPARRLPPPSRIAAPPDGSLPALQRPGASRPGASPAATSPLGPSPSAATPPPAEGADDPLLRADELFLDPLIDAVRRLPELAPVLPLQAERDASLSRLMDDALEPLFRAG